MPTLLQQWSVPFSCPPCDPRSATTLCSIIPPHPLSTHRRRRSSGHGHSVMKFHFSATVPLAHTVPQPPCPCLESPRFVSSADTCLRALLCADRWAICNHAMCPICMYYHRSAATTTGSARGSIYTLRYPQHRILCKARRAVLVMANSTDICTHVMPRNICMFGAPVSVQHTVSHLLWFSSNMALPLVVGSTQAAHNTNLAKHSHLSLLFHPDRPTTHSLRPTTAQSMM